MSTSTVWESGLTCDGPECGREFILGENILNFYGGKYHHLCARQLADEHRASAGESESAVEVAGRQVAAPGRVLLTRRQARDLIAAARDRGVTPVHRPDPPSAGPWYGRMRGWSAARVAAGLSAAEVAGMWLDFLDAGRLPPIRQADVQALLGAIGESVTSS